MALSVKVALLTCLGFIFGMSWLVSLVARPMVELPTPLVVRGPDTRQSTVLATDVPSRSTPTVVAGRFARPSPVEVEVQGNPRDEAALVIAEPLPRDTGLESLSLPPVYVPEAPVIANADQPGEEPTPFPGAGNAVMTMTTIPEAIIADTPAQGARVLAALVGGVEPANETGAGPAVATASDQAARVARKYRVKSGDTLVKIMRREWNSDDTRLLDALLTANPRVAKRRNHIFPGEVLNIPVLQPSANAPALRLAEGRAEGGAPAGPSEWVGRGEVRWYTIRKRDSLASIARRLLNDEARWREIARLNEMRDADKILPGTRIKLPPAETDT